MISRTFHRLIPVLATVGTVIASCAALASVVVTQVEERAAEGLWLLSLSSQQSRAHQMIMDRHDVSAVEVFDEASLAGVEIVYVSPAIGELQITEAEIDALEAFVEAGGRLIIPGDYGEFVDELEPIAARFDVFYGDGYINGSQQAIIIDTDNPVINGGEGYVNDFSAAAVNDNLHSTNPDYRTVALWPDEVDAVGYLQQGAGEAIFLTDFNTWDDDTIGRFDNETFWLNLFDLSGPATRDLLVSSVSTNEVLRYDAATGDFLGAFASGPELERPTGVTWGQDDRLYVASAATGEVLRYDRSTGEFHSVFASHAALVEPRQINFGPDGDLYVCAAGSDSVLQFNRGSGVFLGFAAEGGGLANPSSLTFGPDRDLYVASTDSDQVLRFDPETGDLIDAFIEQPDLRPLDIAFGPDRLFYVVSGSSGDVHRFDSNTGEFVDTFISDVELTNPFGLSWGLDGLIYLTDAGSNEVRRYNAINGDFVDVFVAGGSGGLAGPTFFAFAPVNRGLETAPPQPGVAGVPNLFAASEGGAGAEIGIVYGLRPGSTPVPGCRAIQLSIANPVILERAMADESGHLVAIRDVPAGARGVRIGLQSVDLTNCTVSEPIVHRFE